MSASDIANYALGMVDKAAIYVPSLDGLRKWELAAKLSGGTTGEFMGLMHTMGEDMIRTAGADALALAENGGIAGGAAAKALKAGVDTALLSMDTYKKVEVQYNPKTLNIMGLGGEARSYTAGLGTGSENGINQINNQTSTTLSCELVFSNVNISDAFMTEDLMNFNLEAAAGEIANVAKRMMGKTPSVQPQVDGFMSILTNEYTRMIIFAWGSTVFRGELTRVDCSYKMFNKKGDPIIATVNISIRQGFDDNANMSEKNWRKMFEKTFKELT